jgi:uncharacterized protein with PQ loop repeat
MRELESIPLIATSIAVLARFIFMYLIYTNRSRNSYSLIFCMLSICSSSMWTYYSVEINNFPIMFRSSTEIALLFISAIYIIYNKTTDLIKERKTNNQVAPEVLI